jgi:hypothetical protein
LRVLALTTLAIRENPLVQLVKQQNISSYGLRISMLTLIIVSPQSCLNKGKDNCYSISQMSNFHYPKVKRNPIRVQTRQPTSLLSFMTFLKMNSIHISVQTWFKMQKKVSKEVSTTKKCNAIKNTMKHLSFKEGKH